MPNAAPQSHAAPHRAGTVPASASGRVPWWAWPLVLPGPVLAWHAAIVDALALAPGGPEPEAARLFAWGGVAIVALLVAAEVAFYGMLWSALGRRMTFAAPLLALTLLSTLEPFAMQLLAHAPATAAARPAFACLLGARALAVPGAGASWAAAFGGFGALAVLRMAVWAGVVAAAAGARWREGAVLVGGAYVASHAAWACVLELVLGRSVPR